MENAYRIIKSRYITEKATVLESLQSASSNKCIAKCNTPKVVFLVDGNASKREIAEAVEYIYKEKNVKVVKVNTINAKQKPKRRGKGRPGCTPAFKKAIVSFEPGDTIESI